jgi:hypothetical protein
VDENNARNQKQKVLSLFPRLFQPLETAMRASVIVSVAVLLISVASKAADNAACWDDATRPNLFGTPK